MKSFVDFRHSNEEPEEIQGINEKSAIRNFRSASSVLTSDQGNDEELGITVCQKTISFVAVDARTNQSYNETDV